jgi:signal transduction histidine kinase
MGVNAKGGIFQAFVRIKNAATEHVLGSGLGLSIVKKIALLYHGDVTLQSQPGFGSVFTVTLKAVP